MKINLNPKIEEIFNSLAFEQGMEPQDYAEHVIKKYTLSQINERTIERFKDLPEAEKLNIRESVKTAYEASKKVAPVVVYEPVPTPRMEAKK